MSAAGNCTVLWKLARLMYNDPGGVCGDPAMPLQRVGSEEKTCALKMEPVPSIDVATVRSSSPVGAMHEALERARGWLIGAWIDEARIAAPNLVRSVWQVAQLHPNPVLAVPNRQFGPDRQARLLIGGVCVDAETALQNPTAQLSLLPANACRRQRVFSRLSLSCDLE